MKKLVVAATAACLLVTGLSLSAGASQQTDRIMFERDGHWMTISADGTDMAPVPGLPTGAVGVDWSPDGNRVVYADSSCARGCRAWVLDLRNGHQSQIATFDSLWIDFAWSPDGTHIAYTATAWRTELTTQGPEYSVWVMDADGANQRRVAGGLSPTWSPGGGRLAFACDSALCTANVDGTALQQIPGTTGLGGPRWSPDGSALAAYRGLDGTTFVIGLDGHVEASVAEAGGANWSPDGTTLVLARDPLVRMTAPAEVCLSDPCDSYPGLFLVNRDGSNLRRVTATYDYGGQFAE